MPDETPQTIPADKLAALTGLKDDKHRKLAKDGYFPSPKIGQYQLAATLQGLFRYYRERAAGESIEYESLKQCHAATGIPLAILKLAKAEKLLGEYHRVNITAAFLKWYFTKSPAAQERLEGFRGLDYERERNLRLEANKRERDEAIAGGLIHDENYIEEQIRVGLLMPLRDGLQNLSKKYNRLKPTNPDIADKILSDDLPSLIGKFSNPSEPAQSA